MELALRSSSPACGFARKDPAGRGRPTICLCRRPWSVCRRKARRRTGRLVSALGDFIKTPRVRGVDADAERQSLFVRRLGEVADDVLLRADIHGVPRLIFGIIQIKVVVMVGHGEKVLRAGSFVERDEFFRGPSFPPSKCE